jgi:hypothetical protein
VIPEGGDSRAAKHYGKPQARSSSRLGGGLRDVQHLSRPRRLHKEGKTRLAVVFAVLLSVALCALAAQAGTPPVPIEGKLLVDGWQNDGPFFAYYMSGSSDNLTWLDFWCPDADISPRGDMLAYCDGLDIWKCGFDGSNPTNLSGIAGLGGVNCVPRWSPDASQLAFQRCDPTTPEQWQYPCLAGWHVWVIKADGTGAHQVTPPGSAPSGGPCWSPDGYRLLFWWDGIGNVTMDTDGTDLQVVGSSGEWSPDGSKIASSWCVPDVVDGEPGTWRQLVVTDTLGNSPQVLVQHFVSDADVNAYLATHDFQWVPPLDPFGDVLWWVGPVNMRWSPTGERIAFIADMPFDPDGEYYRYQQEVWIYDLANNDLTKVTSDLRDDRSLSWNGDNTLPTDPTVTVDNTTVTFAEVTEPGLTTILRDDDPPAQPGGYQFCGDYYDVSTTAAVTGPITIQMSYTHAGIPGGTANEPFLALMHYNEATDQWENATTSLDMDSNIISGQVTSLSPIGISVRPPIFGGFRPPINANGSNVFHAGRTIPVKFMMTDALGNLLTDATARLSYWQVSSSIVGTVPSGAEPVWTDAGGAFRYDASAQQYVYNFSTKGKPSGTYLLQVTVDGWPGFGATVLLTWK